eukprot:scaffold16414_cov92-Skeletonema_dohrnii-CCMP3373.AAC.3
MAATILQLAGQSLSTGLSWEMRSSRLPLLSHPLLLLNRKEPCSKLARLMSSQLPLLLRRKVVKVIVKEFSAEDLLEIEQEDARQQQQQEQQQQQQQQEMHDSLEKELQQEEDYDVNQAASNEMITKQDFARCKYLLKSILLLA